jgi:hypothetical protein
LQEERWNPEFLRRKSAVSLQQSAFSPEPDMDAKKKTLKHGGTEETEGLILKLVPPLPSFLRVSKVFSGTYTSALGLSADC